MRDGFSRDGVDALRNENELMRARERGGDGEEKEGEGRRGGRRGRGRNPFHWQTRFSLTLIASWERAEGE